ncbi:DUF4755 domain-containing protein [Salmonella enterica]|nr:DUF4755 domain-containing protein [Salmonella enterica]EEF4028722.1 DUF4755 domain-containing protein [Salmonella enterica]EEJ5984729.1 DUF4755 domain-containing protein [Salmonella enterica]EEL9687431.1 DUF4755 domain-containing protein [Salmonella enterica]EEU3910108.1 DUF4755 domain-containing protein [Salmonella enterica]
MSILTMRRFWVAVSLPLFVAWFFSSGALILLWWLWLPISAPLLIWAFFTYRCNRKEEEEAKILRVNMSGTGKTEAFPLNNGKKYMLFLKFFMMKRVWIAVAIPMFIIYKSGFGGQSLFWSAGLLWMPISAILFFTALNSYLLKLSNNATVDNFNDNDDGCYSHTLSHSSMRIDSRKRTIALRDGNNEKTYSFDDIKSWQYNISHGDAIEGAGLSLTAANLNNMRLAENRTETGFFIKVRDIHNPEWQIHFFPKEGSFKSQKGIKNLEKQMSQWMEVFDQIVNENKG